MKKSLAAWAAGALALASLPLNAATVTSDFNVKVTLTSACTVKTAALDLTFAYTALGSAVDATQRSLVIQCTRGYTTVPTVGLDTGTDKSAASAGQGTTGAGVVSGLQYTLAIGAGSKTATGTAASTSSIGSADEYTYTVDGNMPASQAGSCTTATCSNVIQVRTLTFTY